MPTHGPGEKKGLRLATGARNGLTGDTGSMPGRVREPTGWELSLYTNAGSACCPLTTPPPPLTM
eukprot:5687-Eustigmatos_ZCMA.PRE.1